MSASPLSSAASRNAPVSTGCHPINVSPRAPTCSRRDHDNCLSAEISLQDMSTLTPLRGSCQVPVQLPPKELRDPGSNATGYCLQWRTRGTFMGPACRRPVGIDAVDAQVVSRHCGDGTPPSGAPYRAQVPPLAGLT